MGPKHGPPRGVAVFGPARSKDIEPLDPAIDWDALRRWSLEHDLRLNGEVSSLALLDQRLDVWHADLAHYEKVNLPAEVGGYLGHVIVTNVEGSSWIVWPNGHPVVRLRSGRDLDVTAMANQRIGHAGPDLPSLFADATNY
jgi:hypothetical protein